MWSRQASSPRNCVLWAPWPVIDHHPSKLLPTHGTFVRSRVKWQYNNFYANFWYWSIPLAAPKCSGVQLKFTAKRIFEKTEKLSFYTCNNKHWYKLYHKEQAPTIFTQHWGLRPSVCKSCRNLLLVIYVMLIFIKNQLRNKVHVGTEVPKSM